MITRLSNRKSKKNPNYKCKSSRQSKSKTQKQNPPLGLAKFSFDVHGVSGFKVGDQFRVIGLYEQKA